MVCLLTKAGSRKCDVFLSVDGAHSSLDENDSDVVEGDLTLLETQIDSEKSRVGGCKIFRPLLAWVVVLAGLALLVMSTPASSDDKKAIEASEGSASSRRLRLLTTEQYANTIKHFFGPDITIDVRFAPLPRTDGLLTVGSAIAGVSASGVEVYQKAASMVAAQVLRADRRNMLLPCKPKSDKAADDVCASRFLSQVTRYLYRSPISQKRLTQLVEKAGNTADQLHDFYTGLQIALESVLLSPNVLFVAETDGLDPHQPGTTRLDPLSFASRLSLFLWNAAPDAALREAALKGQLDTEQGRAKIVEMMLASPRLEVGVRAFFDDMFAFDDFATLSKDAITYPYFLGDVPGDAREQTLRTVVDQLLTKNKDYRDLYTTRETFVSPALAVIYGVPTTAAWRAIEFPAEAHRAGILSHVSFLALHAHPTRSSPTLRGKALRELIFCQKVPPPPANVDFSLVNDPESHFKTTRERLAAHRTNPVCAGCHKITDPMGLAMENFDGAGKYRSEEGGSPIDASGSLDGKDFASIEGLTEAIRDNRALSSCLVRRVLTYATGGPLSATSTPAVVNLNEMFASQGFRLRSLLKNVALSNEFSNVEESPAANGPKKAATEPASRFAADLTSKGLKYEHR